MPRRCTVCDHGEHHSINVALVHREPYRTIANQFCISQSALKRHGREHLPELLIKAKHAIEVADADDLLERVEKLFEEAKAVLEAAKSAEDHRVVLAAIDRASRQLELLARLRGELNEQPITNIVLSPEWVEIRTTMMETLEPYRQARIAVAGRLLELEGSSNGSG
jgi:hypothetical protein